MITRMIDYPLTPTERLALRGANPRDYPTILNNLLKLDKLKN